MIDLKYTKTYINQIGKPKVLFIWIPKNAGTSIYEGLQNSLGMKRFLTIEEAKKDFTNNGLVTFGHINVRDLLNESIILEKFYNKAFKFCVSRNPFDRFVSLLHYLKKHNRIPLNYKSIDLINDIINGIPPVGLYNFKGISQCNRQVDWIHNIELDEVLRFESINDGITRLNSLFGKNIGLHHKNKSPNRNTDISELDDKSIQLIQEYYEPDFLKFNYSMKIGK